MVQATILGQMVKKVIQNVLENIPGQFREIGARFSSIFFLKIKNWQLFKIDANTLNELRG